MLLLLPATLLNLLVAAQSASAPGPAPAPTEAEALLHAGKPAEALPLFQSALKANPADVAAQAGEAEAAEQVALAARNAGHEDDALRTLLDAAAYAPRQPKLLYDTAVLEDAMKLYWDADRAVGELKAIPGADTPATEYLAARVKMDLGQFEPAEVAMRTYLQAQPGDASAHYGLGRILQLSQQLDQARAEFERSLALQPRQSESQFQLGEIALAQARYDDAIAEYAKTLADNPKHGGALAGTGIAYFRLKQYPEAQAMLTRAVAAAPDYQPAYYYLGLTLGRLGRAEDSRRELATAASMAEQQNAAAAQRLRLNTQAPQAGSPK